MSIFDEEDANVFSATECTGLIPTLPQDEEEDENYRKLFKVFPER